jgi:hypothetical protein
LWEELCIWALPLEGRSHLQKSRSWKEDRCNVALL